MYYINEYRIGYVWRTVEYDVNTGESKIHSFYPLMPDDVSWRQLPMEQYNDGSNVTVYADFREFKPDE